MARPVSRRGGQGWFLAFGGFQHHVKFSVFKGTSFKPVPPIGQFKNVRSLDVRESDKIDEKQLATWIKDFQANVQYPEANKPVRQPVRKMGRTTIRAVSNGS